MTILGLFAGALTTLSFLPQVIRTMRTHSSRDLSWGWLALFGVGTTTWLLYGVLTTDLPVAATNSVTSTLICVLIALKAWQGFDSRRTRREGPTVR